MDTPTAPIAGSSPATPHTHVKVIDEAHELFGRVCKILSSDATFIVVELETAGSWIKSKLFHSQVAVATPPAVVLPASVVETTETTPAVETAPVAEVVPPVVETAPVPEAPAAS